MSWSTSVLLSSSTQQPPSSSSLWIRPTHHRTLSHLQPPPSISSFPLCMALSYTRPAPTRQHLATSFPPMMLYAHLHLRALQKGNAISYLRTPRSNPDETSPVDMARALDMGCALLRFNLIYGDLIHWLGGFYTDAHRDWSAVFEQLQAVDDCIPPPGYPKVNLHWLF